MKPEDFRQIDEYFNNKGKRELSHFAYPMYVDYVEDAIRAASGGAPLTSQQERSICDGYLTDAQMKTYLAVAEKTQETDRRRNERKSLPFWSSVLSSIVANIIFALLILALWVTLDGPSYGELFKSGYQQIERSEQLRLPAPDQPQTNNEALGRR